MKTRRYIKTIIIAMVSVLVTACAKPNVTTKKPEVAMENPDTSSITDTPNENNPTTPTVPKDEASNTPPTTVEVPKNAAPNTTPPPSTAPTTPNTTPAPNTNTPGTAPNTSTPNTVPTTPSTGYVPATNSSITNIPIRHNYTFLDAVENQVLSLCNAERAKAGAPALTMESKLRDIARYKAMEMLQYNYFSHNSAVSGKSPFDLANSFGYTYSAFGENIQMSQGKNSADVTASYLVTNWMNSPGHRANILNPAFKRMGIGVVFSSDNSAAYESQMFSN